MKTFITVIVATLLVSAGLINQSAPSSDESSAKGWKKLFDGKTKRGWHIYRNEGDGSSWQVEDGMLVFIPKKQSASGVRAGGDIVTDGEYENYHLSLEWKISEGGNSGIIFNVKEDEQFEHTYHTGMEMQVLDNDKHGDGKIKKHRAGDLYDLISCTRETVKPVGEWNHAEVVMNNGEMKLYLNGENVVSTTVWDSNWDKMVAGSKFRDMPGFGKFKKGRISLQDHGDKVWYRNIKIKEL